MFRYSALAVFLFAFSAPAFADVEVIVTASRIDEDARSAPAYVRVISEEEIARGNTVLDALRGIPDLAIRATSPGKESVSLGGFGENGFARVLVLIDGRPINRIDLSSVNWRTIPLDRVERIEVVKGPMSSQYGDQAAAGAINIITRSPEDFSFWIRGDVSTKLTNRQGLGASWGGESFRAAVNVSREDLKPSRDRSESRAIAADVSAGAGFGRFDIDAAGSISDGSFQLPGGLTKDQFDADPDQAVNRSDSFSKRGYGADLSAEADFDPVLVGASMGWKRREIRTDMVSFGSWSDSIYDDLRGTVQAEGEFFLGKSAVLLPVLGLDAGWGQINTKTYKEGGRRDIKSDESPSRLDLGLWARTKALLGSAWSMDCGLRLGYYSAALGSAGAEHLPLVFDFGASYRPGESWAFTLRYGRVFRHPLLDEQASYSGFGPASFNASLKPEYGHHLTASADFRLGRFGAQVAPYFVAMTDEIAYVFPTGNANIGSTYHFGGTASLSWTGRILVAEAAYSFDRAQFAESAKIVPLVPAHTVTGRIIFRPADYLELSTDGRFTTGFYPGGDNANAEAMVPGRFEWSIRIEIWPIEQMSIYWRILNVLDDRTPTLAYRNALYPSAGRVVELGTAIRY